MASANTVVDFSELYERTVGGNALLGLILPGHLAVEFLLRKLIFQYDHNLMRLAGEMNHRMLIDLNLDIGTITKAQSQVLVRINSMRNKLAHQITFQPTLVECKSLWSDAASAFTDMTDGIEQGIAELNAATSLEELEEWVFAELFVQICYDLHSAYVDAGGDSETF